MFLWGAGRQLLLKTPIVASLWILRIQQPDFELVASRGQTTCLMLAYLTIGTLDCRNISWYYLLYKYEFWWICDFRYFFFPKSASKLYFFSQKFKIKFMYEISSCHLSWVTKSWIPSMFGKDWHDRSSWKKILDKWTLSFSSNVCKCWIVSWSFMCFTVTRPIPLHNVFSCWYSTKTFLMQI